MVNARQVRVGCQKGVVMGNTLSKAEIIKLFEGKRHCSQVVISQWVDELGLDEETAIRMMAPFGGGGFCGETCGAVAGALAVIGAGYGHYELGDEEQNAIMIAKTNEFTAKFKEKFGTVVCRELLKEYDVDFSRPGDMERAAETPAFVEACPNYVKGALDILDEIME